MNNGKKNFTETPLTLKKATFLIIVAMATVLLLLNLTVIADIVGWIASVLSPFLIGLFIAFVVNIVMSALENRIFAPLKRFKLWNKIKRGVCILLAFLVVFGVITLLILLIVPQLEKSLSSLAANIPLYIRHWQQVITEFMQEHNITFETIQQLPINWQSIIEKATQIITSLTPQIAVFASSVTSAIFNFLMGIFFALYMLAGKERILANIRKTCLAFFGEKRANRINEIAALTNKTFKGFIVGQLTEVLVLGVLYFIGTSLFRMPYALLISVIMAIGGLIPVFGPILTTIPCVLILLMANPANALAFVIMAIVIQQIEGNFIYPFIIGDSIGLPAIWVLFAILISGSIFGILGMFLSVPFASVLYTLLRQNVNKKLAPVPIKKDASPHVSASKENPKENATPKTEE